MLGGISMVDILGYFISGFLAFGVILSIGVLVYMFLAVIWEVYADTFGRDEYYNVTVRTTKDKVIHIVGYILLCIVLISLITLFGWYWVNKT